MFKKVSKILITFILIIFVTTLNGCFFLMDDENSENSIENYFSGVKVVYKTDDSDFTDYVVQSYTKLSAEILVRLVSAYGYGTELNSSELETFYLGGDNNGNGVGIGINTSLPFEIGIADTHRDAIRQGIGWNFAYTNTPINIDDIGFDINSYLFNDNISVESSYNSMRINDVMFDPTSVLNGYNMLTATGYLDGLHNGYNTNYIQILTLKILSALTGTIVNEFDSAVNIKQMIFDMASQMEHTGIIGAESDIVSEIIFSDIIGGNNYASDVLLVQDGIFYGYEFADQNFNEVWDSGEPNVDLYEFITGESSLVYNTGMLMFNEEGEPTYDNSGVYNNLFSVREENFKNYTNTVYAILNYITYGKESGDYRYPQITSLSVRDFSITEIKNPNVDGSYYANMPMRNYQSMIFMVSEGKTVSIEAIMMFLNSMQSGTNDLNLQVSLRYQHNGVMDTYKIDNVQQFNALTSEQLIMIDSGSKSQGVNLPILSAESPAVLNAFDNSAMTNLLTATPQYDGTNRSDFEFKIYNYSTLATRFAPATSQVTGLTNFYYYDPSCDYLEIVFENTEVGEDTEFKIGLPSIMLN